MLINIKDVDRIKHGECLHDEGGYFIVNGGEKAIVAQEKMAHNIILCFYKKDQSLAVLVFFVLVYCNFLQFSNLYIREPRIIFT